VRDGCAHRGVRDPDEVPGQPDAGAVHGRRPAPLARQRDTVQVRRTHHDAAQPHPPQVPVVEIGHRPVRHVRGRQQPDGQAASRPGHDHYPVGARRAPDEPQLSVHCRAPHVHGDLHLAGVGIAAQTQAPIDGQGRHQPTGGHVVHQRRIVELGQDVRGEKRVQEGHRNEVTPGDVGRRSARQHTEPSTADQPGGLQKPGPGECAPGRLIGRPGRPHGLPKLACRTGQSHVQLGVMGLELPIRP
jgi:hypothetical protein